MGNLPALWLVALLGVVMSLADTNVQNTTVSLEKEKNPIQIKNLTGKVTNTTLEPHTVDVFHRWLTKQQALDLVRVSVDIVDPQDIDDHKGSLLEVSVSNGRDNFVLSVPVKYPNLTLYTDGKLLDPLAEGDFGGKRKKNKNHAENSNSQNLVITVQSRLHTPIEYKLWITTLDRSQYVIRFSGKNSTIEHPNQHLSFLKPVGYFLNAHEQNVQSFRITVTSDDDFCANLIALPASESLYGRRIDLDELDNRRILSFTRRADVFLSEQEISAFNEFRVFVVVLPEDSSCAVKSSRKSYKDNKKVNISFEKLEHSSYFVPILGMLAFFATPLLIFLPSLLIFWTTRRSRNPIVENLINVTDSPDSTFSPSAPNEHISEEPLENEDSVHIDSLSVHGQMLRYPIAIILPVLMHTAVEYHKWSTSTSANRDEQCFHNHACAKPYGELRAFNNIVSNVGYALYGTVFVAVTLLRRRRLSADSGTFECTLIDVTIGVFMVLQAIASATYHICPSDVAFQFDTPCIQVICCLLIVRQWLVRIESPSAAYSNIVLVAVVSLNFLISALSTTNYIRYMLAGIHISIIATFCLAKKSVLQVQEEPSRRKLF